jgi:hypothetical protein
MASSGTLRCVALVRTEVSEELRVSLIRLTRIGEIGTTTDVRCEETLCDFVFLRSVGRLLVRASVVPRSPIIVTVMKEALSFSDTLVLTRATRRNIPEDAILHNHRRKYLKSYILHRVVLSNGVFTGLGLGPGPRSRIFWLTRYVYLLLMP